MAAVSIYEDERRRLAPVPEPSERIQLRVFISDRLIHESVLESYGLAINEFHAIQRAHHARCKAFITCGRLAVEDRFVPDVAAPILALQVLR